ncbi:hypothetical protein LCGC14_1801090 [marine sediment metagenome]|uniref:Uncharacterized protein n=1 Tax=marine sediment metagenome TaxID=412755 RepID=A0A0F9GPH0_9ZZZZ
MKNLWIDVLIVLALLVFAGCISNAGAIGGSTRQVAFNTEFLCPNGSYSQLPNLPVISYALLRDSGGVSDIRLCTTEDGDACAVVADGFRLDAVNPSYNDDHKNPNAWRCLGDGTSMTIFIVGSKGQ